MNSLAGRPPIASIAITSSTVAARPPNEPHRVAVHLDHLTAKGTMYALRPKTMTLTMRTELSSKTIQLLHASASNISAVESFRTPPYVIMYYRPFKPFLASSSSTEDSLAIGGTSGWVPSVGFEIRYGSFQTWEDSQSNRKQIV